MSEQIDDPEPDWGEEIEGFDLPLGDLWVAVDRTSTLMPVTASVHGCGAGELRDPVGQLRRAGEKLTELAALVERAEKNRRALR